MNVFLKQPLNLHLNNINIFPALVNEVQQKDTIRRRLHKVNWSLRLQGMYMEDDD